MGQQFACFEISNFLSPKSGILAQFFAFFVSKITLECAAMP